VPGQQRDTQGVRFLDSRRLLRTCCWTAGYLRVPFPTCWCSFTLPAGMTEAMVAAWRAEVRDVWPDLDDDAVLLPALLDAQRCGVGVHLVVPAQGRPGRRAVESDARSPDGASRCGPGGSNLARDAARAGEHDVVAQAHEVVAGAGPAIRRPGSSSRVSSISVDPLAGHRDSPVIVAAWRFPTTCELADHPS